MRTALIYLAFPVSLLAQTLSPFGNNLHSAVIHDAIVYNNLLFLGGTPGKVNNVTINGVAIYDGVTTSTLPGAGFTRAFAIHNNNLYMVGNYPNGEHALRWDGQTLTPLGLTNGVNFLTDLAEFNGDLYGCGQFQLGGVFYALAKYDGTSWAYEASLPNSNEMGLVMHTFNNQLYLGGGFTSINGIACNSIVAHNGSTWNNLLGGPNNGDSIIVRGLFTSGPNLVVVSTAFAIPPARVSQWTGISWNAQNFSQLLNADWLNGFSTSGQNFIAAEYLQPPFQQDSLLAGHVYLYTSNGLLTLTDSLFRDEEFIPIRQLVTGIVFYNNQWILYGDFKKEGRNGPSYPGLAAVGGLLGDEENDEELSLFRFFPNPTSDYLLFENTNRQLPYTIYDLHGRVVLTGMLAAKVDVRTLPGGQYIIKVTDAGIQHRQQFVKVD